LGKTLRYIKYKLTSRHKKGYGIHSPFVYGLIRNIFMNKNKIKDYTLIENYIQEVKSSQLKINVNDLGAGSRKLNTRQRRISSIAKTAGTKQKYGKLLYRFAKEYGKNDIVELGTSLGIGTMYLALGSGMANIHTLEGCTETYSYAKQSIEKKGITNVSFYNTEFEEGLELLLEDQKIIPDLIFIDGNHRYEKTLQYFNYIKKYIHNDTIIIFDDINWSEDMHNAWKEIQQDKKVSVSIDIFQWGIVSCRKEQTKQHFVIKF